MCYIYNVLYNAYVLYISLLYISSLVVLKMLGLYPLHEGKTPSEKILNPSGTPKIYMCVCICVCVCLGTCKDFP